MINRCRHPERAILAAVATAEGTALSSVDRALRLLEELARHGPLGATELANRTGCAKATAFRLARTLQARGFVVQNQDSSYRLGPRCLLLATGVHTSFDVRREALPAMEALRDAGVFRTMQPKRFGGYEYGPAELAQIGFELGRACGSTGWCGTLAVCFGWKTAFFPLEASAPCAIPTIGETSVVGPKVGKPKRA